MHISVSLDTNKFRNPRSRLTLYEMASGALVVVLAVMVAAVMVVECSETAEIVYSARLLHRFSEDVRVGRSGEAVDGGAKWPRRRSLEYYKMLMSNDLRRQKMRLGPRFNLLYPSQGSSTLPLGNDFGWLHYMWIDIGTPSVSFLVALDAGSDLLWIPCNCIQCAPLSASYYSSLEGKYLVAYKPIRHRPTHEFNYRLKLQNELIIRPSIHVKDKDLHEYNPSGSSTSKYIACSHELCELGPNCKNPVQHCPYTINYESDDTSTSGLLVEDVLHLTSGQAGGANNSVRAPVIIGCGSKQSGVYLDGVAPDGLMGLGLGKISIPSSLAKAGLVQDSFSLCFDENDSGRLFFGGQGVAGQQNTSFLPLEGNYVTYVVGVDACCIGSSCLGQTNFRAIVDSGSSFSFLPDKVYERVVEEFDRQVTAMKSSFEGYPWQYCYKSSSHELPKMPSVTLKFAMNNSFEVHDPVFIIYGSEGAVGFCLAIQPADGDMGTIGQNFMAGYSMVFDRENLKLGWSRSDCQDLSNGKGMPMNLTNGGSSNPLPATEQQNASNGHALSPAIAGKTHSKSSASSTRIFSCQLCLGKFMFLLLQALHTAICTLYICKW